MWNSEEQFLLVGVNPGMGSFGCLLVPGLVLVGAHPEMVLNKGAIRRIWRGIAFLGLYLAVAGQFEVSWFFLLFGLRNIDLSLGLTYLLVRFQPLDLRFAAHLACHRFRIVLLGFGDRDVVDQYWDLGLEFVRGFGGLKDGLFDGSLLRITPFHLQGGK